MTLFGFLLILFERKGPEKGTFIFLLSLGIVPVDTIQSSPLKLIHHILAAARKCVTKCWKNEHAHSKDMWLGLCGELADMDSIGMKVSGQSS